MTEDKKEGAVSEGTVSEETPKADELDPKIAEMIADKVKAGVKEASEHFQAIADRDIRSHKKRADRAVGQARDSRANVAAMRTAYRGAGASGQAVRLADQDFRDNQFAQQEQEETQREQLEKFTEDFEANAKSLIEQFGIDPKDERINWGEDSSDFLQRQKLILTSVAKITESNQGAFKEKLEKQLEDQNRQTRKDLGLDSADSSIPTGSKRLPTAEAIGEMSYKEWVDAGKPGAAK